jgi:NAD(P)H-dependent nitrite reductase small subunit
MSKVIKVGPVSEIAPKQAKIVEVDGAQIAVFNVDGTFCAINNICPHRGGPLGEGDVQGTVVTCPWHGWQFDVKTGQNPVNPAASVRTFPCKVEGGDVCIEV